MNNRLAYYIFLYLFIFLTSLGFTGQSTPSVNKIIYACSDWVPMSYEDSRGIPRGLYIDILNEIFVKQLEIPLLTRVSPWKRAQIEVKNGVSDFLLTVATQDRLHYTTKSEEPLFLLYLYIYTYTNHPLRKEIDQIKTTEDIIKLDLTTVTNLGNGWHINNMEVNGVKTHYVRLEESALGFLSMKRADIMIDALVPTNHLINEMGLSSKIQLTKSRFGPVKMHLLMSNKSRFLKLMPEINKAFKKLRDNGVVDEIISGYTSLGKSDKLNKKVFAGELK